MTVRIGLCLAFSKGLMEEQVGVPTIYLSKVSLTVWATE